MQRNAAFHSTIANFSAATLLSTVAIALPVSLTALLPATPVVADTLQQSLPQTRMRVAVIDFEFTNTGTDYSVSGFANDYDLAQGISNLVTNKLVQNGRYSMIERSRVAEVLREQNFGASGRVDAATAAEIGRILGADAVIIGSVIRFNLESRESHTGIGGLFGSRRETHQANVQLAARLVNTTTSEIMAAAEGKGAAEQRSERTSVFGVTVGRSGSNDQELLSQAAEVAANELTTQLVAAAN